MRDRRDRKERQKRIDCLRAVALLAACTDAELERVDGLGAQVDVRAGTTLTREGHYAGECFVVFGGTAVAAHGAQALGLIGAGSLAGEMALLDSATRCATVVARTPMRLTVLTPGEFTQLMRVAPSIEEGVRRLATERRAVLNAALS